MFKKILVANRGEIAVRILRSAQELGIRVVTIYEETDREGLHTMQADEAVCVGPGPRKDYLDIPKIIRAALNTGCEAIHPGYGFLAENPKFPEECTKAGMAFIGPPPDVIKNLGSKVVARRIMTGAGIPVIPGTDILSEGEKGDQEALDFTSRFGFPIMIKAVAGGGGRGIRMVEDEKSLLQGLRFSRSEAKMAFGNSQIYLEKTLINPRHVEVQILADQFGKVIHMGTRNCSIQRRHQKLIEIAPANLPSKLNKKICDTAISAAIAAKYESAGTVEFLIDEEDNFYFLEVNTRIQVEHTVTEMITGIDIIREQLKIAANQPLSITQDEVVERGVAIELRINAEDPKNNFLASPGKIEVYISPGGHGIRLDGAIYQGYEIPRYYDSMLVKLTVYGFDWHEAVDRLRRALNNFVILGVNTTIPYFQQIVNDPDFINQRFDTSYIDTHPHLLEYREEERVMDKIAKIVADINAYRKNPFVY